MSSVAFAVIEAPAKPMIPTAKAPATAAKRRANEAFPACVIGVSFLPAPDG
jgi:hypothetical protein